MQWLAWIVRKRHFYLIGLGGLLWNSGFLKPPWCNRQIKIAFFWIKWLVLISTLYVYFSYVSLLWYRSIHSPYYWAREPDCTGSPASFKFLLKQKHVFHVMPLSFEILAEPCVHATFTWFSDTVCISLFPVQFWTFNFLWGNGGFW